MEVKGFTASKGAALLVAGRARVMTDVKEIDTLEPTDILICQMTAPDWAPAFDKIAGLVTADGGQLCHAAIVAREYHLPCIVGAAGVTTKIKDGTMILLDLSAGVVKEQGSKSEMWAEAMQKGADSGGVPSSRSRWADFGREF